MKKLPLSILFLIALLVGLNIAAPAAIAMSEPDEPDEIVSDDVDDEDNEALAATQDQNAANSAAATSINLGTIYVGPSASGEAVRILSTGYTLAPLCECNPGDPSCCNANPIVVGPRDLFTPWIVDRLKASYEAGHGVALTNATAADIEHLRNLLGHHGSLQHNGSGEVDLVAFRKAQRTDGQFHFSSHILLPRTAAETGLLTRQEKKRLKRVSGAVRRKLRRKLVKLERRHRQQAQVDADRNDAEALGRVFSVTPVVPESPPTFGDDGQQNLLQIAESYETHAVQSDSIGDQAQIVNTVWAARSFLNSADFYYVLEDADYSVAPGFNGNGTLKSWVNQTVSGSHSLLGFATILSPAPQTTMEARQLSGSVSKTLGVKAGWNLGTNLGFNASVTQSTTITNSWTVTVPPINVTNGADFVTGEANWVYNVNDRPRSPESITLRSHWIWQVPFSLYDRSGSSNLLLNSTSYLSAHYSRRGKQVLQVNISPVVPWPFGSTFALQQPVVSGVNPACVRSGDEFTIQGTGMYPSMVTAVLIGGTPVSSANITTVSDTKINVIAPDISDCQQPGCPVAVQTAIGTSNTNFNIVISDSCD